MTIGLQNPSDQGLLAGSAITPAHLDSDSLKMLLRTAGGVALAGGGSALLLHSLLRPNRPEFKPSRNNRIVQNQPVETPIALRPNLSETTSPISLGAPETVDAEFAISASEEAANGGVDYRYEQQGGAEEPWLGNIPLEESVANSPANGRSGNPNQRGQGNPRKANPGAAGVGADGEGLADDGLDGAGDSELGMAGVEGPSTMMENDGEFQEGEGQAQVAASVSPPDVSTWLDGPISSLAELKSQVPSQGILQTQQSDSSEQVEPVAQDDLALELPITNDPQGAELALGPEVVDELPAFQSENSFEVVGEQPQNITIAPPTPLPKDGIYVERFEVTGNSVFSAEKLAQVAQAAVLSGTDNAQADDPSSSQVGKVLSPAELVQASDAITQFYTKEGYVNSGAYVPEAVLDGALPEIRVVEGKLESINVDVKPAKGFGLSRPLSKRYIQRRLARAGSGALNLDRLVDSVRLLELDPLIESISTELKPGSVTGSSVLNVEVQQAKTFAGALTMNNYRSPSIGSMTQGISLQQSNLLGRGDRAQLGFSRSSGSRSLELGYSLPINAKNGTISLRHNRNSSKVIEDPFSALDAVSKSRATELKLRQPIVKTPKQELAASMTLSRYYSKGEILNSLPLTSSSTNDEGETRISALRLGQEWSRKGEKQFLALQSEFSLGLGSLGGGDVRQEGQDSRFLAWRGKGRAVRSLGNDAIASLKGELQLSANSLAPVERFSVGGPTTVRGYRQNTNLTDSGWLISAETQLPIMRFPKRKAVVQLAPFVDMGGGWNIHGNQPDQGFLASTGIGTILRVGDDFSARLDYGIPLTSVENDGNSLQDSGITFSINYSPF